MVGFTKNLFMFTANAIGCARSPYITYRRLADEHRDSRHIIVLFTLSIGYFVFASLLRTGMKNPFLLTWNFYILTSAGIASFTVIVGFLYGFGKIVGSQGRLRSLLVTWSYSLIPTLIWFFSTSVLYMLFPPPRGYSPAGVTYSVVFVTFSLSLLVWKLILYYLTLRFALRLDLFRIVLLSMILGPLLAVYAIGMYRLGIFRIPFI